MKELHVIDECGAIIRLAKLAREDTSKEHCSVAIARERREHSLTVYRIASFCMVEEVGGRTNNKVSIIPREVSLSLLRACKKGGYAPVVLHTHIPHDEYPGPVSFSDMDMNFICHFISKAESMQQCAHPLFVVTDGTTTMFYANEKSYIEYYPEELEG